MIDLILQEPMQQIRVRTWRCRIPVLVVFVRKDIVISPVSLLYL